MRRMIIPIRADQTRCQRSQANGDTMDENSSFDSEDRRNLLNLPEGEPAARATETAEHSQEFMSPAQDDAPMEEFGEEWPAESPNSASEVEPSKTEFDAPPRLEGEITLSLGDLSDWKYHCAALSKQSDAADAALVSAAVDPEFLPPIEVIKGGNGKYAVKDGHRRVRALRTVHHNKMDTQVRCIVYTGTEEQAVRDMCDDAVGTAMRTKIQSAIAVRNVHRVTGLTQVAITVQYPSLRKDQVSLMIKAAGVFEEYPVVFNLLRRPDRVSIDTCVRIHDRMKDAGDEEVGAFIAKAEDLAAEGASFTTTELLEAFGIDGPAKKAGGLKADPFEPADRTEVFGDDDQVVGSLDMHSDNVTRLRLPDPNAMTIEEREVAAKAFIKQIYAYFELDAD